jgi:hypothetical protein
LHTLAIVPTIRVTNKQMTTALEVRGHIYGCAHSPVMTIMGGFDTAHVVGYGVALNVPCRRTRRQLTAIA